MECNLIIDQSCPKNFLSVTAPHEATRILRLGHITFDLFVNFEAGGQHHLGILLGRLLGRLFGTLLGHNCRFRGFLLLNIENMHYYKGDNLITRPLPTLSGRYLLYFPPFTNIVGEKYLRFHRLPFTNIATEQLASLNKSSTKQSQP